LDSGTKGGLGHVTCPSKVQEAQSGGNLPHHASAENGATYSRYSLVQDTPV
jgi:hypothetical protein